MISTSIDHIVSAFLAFDQQALVGANDDSFDADPDIELVRAALLSYLRADAGEQGWENIEEELKAASDALSPEASYANKHEQDYPFLDPELLTLTTLIKAARIKFKAQQHLTKVSEAWQELKVLEASLTPAMPDEVRAFIWHVRISIELRDDIPAAYESTNHALALNLKEGSPLWYAMKTDQIVALNYLRRFKEVKLAIEALKDIPGREALDKLVTWSLPLSEAFLCYTIGPLDRGIEILKEIQQRNLKVNQRMFLLLRFNMLTYAGKLSAAEALINSGDMSILSEQHKLSFQAFVALARGDADSAIRQTLDAMARNDGDAKYEWNCLLTLVMSHLANRDAAKSKKILDRMDCLPTNMPPILAWMRYEILIGNEDAAVDWLVDILKQIGAEGVRMRLNFAHELSTSQLNRVWARAEVKLREDPTDQGNWVDVASVIESPASTSTAMASTAHTSDKTAALLTTPQTTPPTNGHAKNALARRHRLRQLFVQYPQLTRSQVAKQLACALATAAKDLSELEQEGLIQRIDTSAHARTSYYQRVE